MLTLRLAVPQTYGLEALMYKRPLSGNAMFRRPGMRCIFPPRFSHIYLQLASVITFRKSN